MKLFLLLFLLLASSVCQAALVQFAGSTVLGSNTTAGNALVFSCRTNSTVDDISGITDSEGNTFVKAKWFAFSGAGQSLYTFVALNIAGGTHDQVLSYLGGGSCIGAAWFSEWSGFPSSGTVVDGTSGNGSTTPGSCDPGTITSVASNNLIYSVSTDYSTGTCPSGTPPCTGALAPGYSLVGLTGSVQAAEYIIATGTSNDPFFAAPSGGGTWICEGVAFKQTGGGGGSTAPRRRVIN